MKNESGFTLIEMLVVLALSVILVFLSLPALQTTVRQAKMRGFAQEMTVMMRQARLDAIKSSAQAVVRIVLPTPADPIGKLMAFSDRDGDGKLGATEPVLGALELPSGVLFKDPLGKLDKDSVSGFSANADDSGGPNVALFQRDGSIAAVGAFRLGDELENYLEVRVEPAATARIEVHKWQDNAWIANGDKGEAWTWN